MTIDNSLLTLQTQDPFLYQAILNTQNPLQTLTSNECARLRIFAQSLISGVENQQILLGEIKLSGKLTITFFTNQINSQGGPTNSYEKSLLDLNERIQRFASAKRALDFTSCASATPGGI